LIDSVREIIHDEVPDAQIVRPRYEPVTGAALLALDEMEIAWSQTHVDAFECSLPEALKLERDPGE
jgi:hypothetical protein